MSETNKRIGVDLPPVFTTPEEIWGEEVANFLESSLEEKRLGASADPFKEVGESVWETARAGIGNIELGPLFKRGNENVKGWEEQDQESFMEAGQLFLENPNILPTIHGPVDINWMGFHEGGLSDKLKEKEEKWIKKEIIGLDDKENIREDWKLEPIFNVIEYKKKKGLVDKDFRIPIVFHASPPTGKDLIISEGQLDKNKENAIAFVDETTGDLIYRGDKKSLEELGFKNKEELRGFLEESLYSNIVGSLGEKVMRYHHLNKLQSDIKNLYKILDKKEIGEEEIRILEKINPELLRELEIENFHFDPNTKTFKIKEEDRERLKNKLDFYKDVLIKSQRKKVVFDIERELKDIHKRKGESFSLESKDKESIIKKAEETLKDLLKNGNGNKKDIVKVKELEESALEKASETIANVALGFYKNPKLRKHSFIAVETFFPEDFFSTGDKMRELIVKSREKFKEKLIKEKNVDEKTAEKIAEELIGITLDVAHWNLWKSRDPSVNDEWLKEQIKKIAPYVKHFHLADNPGTEDTHQEIGTGNVPNKEAFEILMKEGNWKSKPGTITIEWGSPFGPKGKQPSNRENWLASINPHFSKIRTMKNNYYVSKFELPQPQYNKFIGDSFTSFLK